MHFHIIKEQWIGYGDKHSLTVNRIYKPQKCNDLNLEFDARTKYRNRIEASGSINYYSFIERFQIS